MSHGMIQTLYAHATEMYTVFCTLSGKDDADWVNAEIRELMVLEPGATGKPRLTWKNGRQNDKCAHAMAITKRTFQFSYSHKLIGKKETF